jgi:protein-S-isoprenylcysteine O-methyltransferase Ste14
MVILLEILGLPLQVFVSILLVLGFFALINPQDFSESLVKQHPVLTMIVAVVLAFVAAWMESYCNKKFRENT